MRDLIPPDLQEEPVSGHTGSDRTPEQDEAPREYPSIGPCTSLEAMCGQWNQGCPIHYPAGVPRG